MLDYGSTFGFIVFAQELVLLGYCFVRGDRGARFEENELPQDRVRNVAKYLDEEEGGLNDDTRFLFDVVARRNEAIVQNIDALDGGLIAVVVGAIAITLFAADKWFDLEPNFRFAAFFFLGEAAIAAFLGFSAILFVERGTIDDAVFSDFSVDFAESPLEATSTAIADLACSAKANTTARCRKQAFIIVSTVLAITAAAVIVAGRALHALH